MAKPQMDMAGYIIYHGQKRPAKVAHDDRVSVQRCDGSFDSGFAYKIDWREVAAYAVIPRIATAIIPRPASPYQATRDRPGTLDELITDYCDFKREIYSQIRTVVKWQKAHTPTREAMEAAE